jgi:ABC-type branched-subunit amino acid transport system ATPase component
LNGVSLTAQPGQITALIGANGSGKTTLLNLVCGYSRADQGTITFGETALTGKGPHQIARVGVGRTFQTPSLPRGVSALDVVASGRFSVDRCGLVASALRLPRYWRSRHADRREASALLELMGLAQIADQEATSLSIGTRRLVEVARALCATPRLLLLDEPASGLSEQETATLGDVITAAARAGATVVLIEHNFAFVTAVSDVAYVLDFGSLIASGPAGSIARDPLVIESFLGQAPEPAGGGGEAPAASENAPAAPFADGDLGADRVAVNASRNPDPPGTSSGPLLAVSRVSSGYGDLQVLRDVSMTVEHGKIEVALGRNGVGKTTLLNTIAGQVRLWDGSVKLGGEEVGRRPAYRRAEGGMALVQEGKRIFRGRTVLENLMLGTFTLPASRRERRQLCDEVLEHFPMLEERLRDRAGDLSGGQQQMLAIAQALASRPILLLLDEPSAGLAPAIVRELFQRIRGLGDQGMTILLVEQVAEQALAIADHVTVIDNGRVVATGPPQQFNEQRELREAYFGGSSGPGDPAERAPQN